MGRPRIYNTDEERRAHNADRIRRWRRENPEKVYASRLRAAARLIERNQRAQAETEHDD